MPVPISLALLLHLFGMYLLYACLVVLLQELEKLLAPHGVVLAGHCTGWRGKTELANTLPGRYQPCVVGGQWVFEAHE
jgi:metal-dependent hydrolase (beta-lactamase superfamily II)